MNTLRKPHKIKAGYRRRSVMVEIWIPYAEEDSMIASYIYSALATWGRGLDREHRLYHGILVKAVKIGKKTYEATREGQ